MVKLIDIVKEIREEEVNELNLKKAIATSALALGLAGSPNLAQAQAQDKAPTTQTYSKGYENQKPDKEMATKMLGVGTSIDFDDTKKDAAMVAVTKYCMGIRDGKINVTPKQFLGSDEFMSNLTGKEMIAMYNALYKIVSDSDQEGQKIALNKGNAVTRIYEGVHDPVKPGILKKRLGTLSCSRVRSAKSKLKDKGTHYAKALQRYLNYHC
jgi:hypothetical protein